MLVFTNKSMIGIKCYDEQYVKFIYTKIIDQLIY